MLDLVPFRHRYSLPDMFKEMEDFFNKAWRREPFTELTADLTACWNPSVDVVESDDTITVKADLPGLDAKDIDISIDNDLLVIKGEKKQEKEEKDKRFHRIERTYGSFYRALRLPGEIKKDKIDASYKNGVLNIVLPKAEEEKKKITHVKIH